MAVDLVLIRQAVANRIEETTNLRTYPFPVQSDVYPRVMVMNGSPLVATAHGTFRSPLCDINLIVEVATKGMDPVPAQEELARYVSSGTGFETTSVMDALEDLVPGEQTPTLDGLVENINVESVSVDDGEPIDGGLVFTALFRVTVRARRN